MNRLSVLLLLPLGIAALLLLASCEKLEMPTDPEAPPTEQPADTTGTTAPATEDPLPPPDEGNTGERRQTTQDSVEYVAYIMSESMPFLISEVKTYIPVYLRYFDASGVKEIWVQGYIVGNIDGNAINQMYFGAGRVETNVVLADDPTEKDYRKCMAVQLTNSSQDSQATRKDLNLVNHPENLGKHVCIYGNIDPYMRVLGLKYARDYEWLEEE